MGLPSQDVEHALWARGVEYVVGVDEAGRGAWAGPLVAAAAIMPRQGVLKKVRDSKLVSPVNRERVFDQITQVAVDWAIGSVSCEEIDARGIQWANAEAMCRAVRGLTVTPQHAVVDGSFHFELPVTSSWVVNGDAHVYSIACASILAKVTRDRLMVELHQQFPQYRFHQHKGYGTADHRRALYEHGISPFHRRSFQPIADAMRTVSAASDNLVYSTHA